MVHLVNVTRLLLVYTILITTLEFLLLHHRLNCCQCSLSYDIKEAPGLYFGGVLHYCDVQSLLLCYTGHPGVSVLPMHGS